MTKHGSGAQIQYLPPLGTFKQTEIIKKINADEWMKLLHDFYRCYIIDWKKQYADPDILDGTQWELAIKLNDNTVIQRSGSNAYPPHWKKLIAFFNTHVSSEIS